jgi:hypothetical protein
MVLWPRRLGNAKTQFVNETPDMIRVVPHAEASFDGNRKQTGGPTVGAEAAPLWAGHVDRRKLSELI